MHELKANFSATHIHNFWDVSFSVIYELAFFPMLFLSWNKLEQVLFDCAKPLYVYCCSQDTIVTSLVLATEAAKVICTIVLLIAEGSLKKQFRNWTLAGSLTASGLPAAIYALQNSLLQISYKNLDSLTFSILNQTKLLWTAFFTYLILGCVLVTHPIYILVSWKYSKCVCVCVLARIIPIDYLRTFDPLNVCVETKRWKNRLLKLVCRIRVKMKHGLMIWKPTWPLYKYFKSVTKLIISPDKTCFPRSI